MTILSGVGLNSQLYAFYIEEVASEDARPTYMVSTTATVVTTNIAVITVITANKMLNTFLFVCVIL